MAIFQYIDHAGNKQLDEQCLFVVNKLFPTQLASSKNNRSIAKQHKRQLLKTRT
jgi:transcriptional regulatory protein LevR